MNVGLDRDKAYLYRINPEGYWIETGTANGKQVLLGLWFPFLVSVFFDVEGNFICCEKKRLLPKTELLGGRSFYANEFREHVRDERNDWEKQFGFRHEPINVKRFSVPIYDLEIQDYPSFVSEVLSDPNSFSADDLLVAQETLATWNREGQFILHWCDDYWVNKDGEIVAA